MVCVFNFYPVPHASYRLGLPEKGSYGAVFSTHRKRFGGSRVRLGPVAAKNIPLHGYPYSGDFSIPPLSATFYKIKKKIS